MRMDARATRGGPLSARIALALFCLSLTVLFGFSSVGELETGAVAFPVDAEGSAGLSLEDAAQAERFAPELKDTGAPVAFAVSGTASCGDRPGR